VDGEPLALRALDIGCELSRSTGAKLGLIHVIDPAFLEEPGSVLSARDGNTTSHKEARQLFSNLRQRANVPAPSQVFMLVGKPASEIVQAARTWPADLIVIGSHGRSRVQRALLGSVADEVLRHAPCPVLVVRFPEQGA
jgi:nucleotide-binding universal stress UspA family protein